jgi:hypothetical protein
MRISYATVMRPYNHWLAVYDYDVNQQFESDKRLNGQRTIKIKIIKN